MWYNIITEYSCSSENFLLSSALNHLNFVFSLSPSFYLPESLLRRICFVTPSNKGTQKRRKNEEGTKEERTKGVQKGDIGGVGGWKGFWKTKWREGGVEEGVVDDEK